MKYKYFSYDPDDVGFEFHETAENAKLRARECMWDCLSNGWDEKVLDVCWGEVKGRATQIKIENVDERGYLPCGEYIGHGIDYYEDCELQEYDQAIKIKESSADEIQNNDSQDDIRNPVHYKLIDGVESIEVIVASLTGQEWKGFCLGNILKYRIRAGKKGSADQDLSKADYYAELYNKYKKTERLNMRALEIGERITAFDAARGLHCKAVVEAHLDGGCSRVRFKDNSVRLVSNGRRKSNR